MRVFWYWPWPAHRWLAVAAGVAAAPHHVTLQCFGATPDEALPAPPPGVTLLPDLPRPSPRVERTAGWAADRAVLLAQRSRLRAWRLRTVGTDVVHLHLLQPLLDPVLLASLGRRHRLVSSVHDLRPHQSRLPRAVEDAALRRLYAHAGHLVVHHPTLAEGLTGEFGVDPDRVTVLPHPVFPPAPAGPAAPAATGASLLFFGSLRRNKGLAVLLQAMAILADEDVRLTIAGRGAPDVERLAQEAADRDGRITAHVGYIPDGQKAALYRAADLVVLPYTAFTSQSGVLHDAYAHGRAAVVTDVGALGSTVRADGTGWVVPPADPEALAAALATALHDHDALGAAAAAAAAVAAERSPLTVGRGLAAVYQRLTGLGPDALRRAAGPEEGAWASTS